MVLYAKTSTVLSALPVDFDNIKRLQISSIVPYDHSTLCIAISQSIIHSFQMVPRMQHGTQLTTFFSGSNGNLLRPGRGLKDHDFFPKTVRYHILK